MLLAIDIGNTRTKAAVFEGSTLLKYFAFETAALKNQVAFIIAEFKNITNITVASVAKHCEIPFLEGISSCVVGRSWAFPFKNCYSTPETLGIDRMILASGAVLMFPGKNRLIIDAGTCITYDFVNDADEYLGGAISPGVRMRYESLHEKTANLPLLNNNSPEVVVGDSTEASIHSGVINGIVFEINGFINNFNPNQGNFIIILTGGDGDLLAKRLKNTIFANSNFLLESLNQTFLHQNNND
jgi:type III pantothenate kinase